VKRLSFSLLWLLGVIALIAIACASLRSASEIWASAAFTATLGVLLLSVVGLIFRHRASRAFWGGFALMGWSYLFLVFGPWCRENAGPQLLTTKLLEYVHPKLQRSAPPSLAVTLGVPAVGSNGWTAGGARLPANTATISNADFDGDGMPDLVVTGGAPAPMWTTSTVTFSPTVTLASSPQHFMQVGHSLWALLLASAGGLLARYFYEKRTRPKQDEGAGS
jgi:hypothetical protein